MLDVFVDRGCALRREPRIGALAPVAVDVVNASTWDGLADGGIVLVGVRTADGAPALPSIRAFRQKLPHVVIVLCAEWREAGRVQLSGWTLAGVDEFVTFGEAVDVAEVLRVVQVRLQAPPPAEELRLLRAGSPPSWELEVVLHGLRNASSPLSPGELARRFGCSPRSLRDYLSGAGYPPPRELCRVGLLLHVAELSEHGITDPREVAARLGSCDPAALRQAKSRLRQTVLRGRDDALGRFVAALPRLLNVLAVKWTAPSRSSRMPG